MSVRARPTCRSGGRTRMDEPTTEDPGPGSRSPVRTPGYPSREAPMVHLAVQRASSYALCPSDLGERPELK